MYSIITIKIKPHSGAESTTLSSSRLVMLLLFYVRLECQLFIKLAIVGMHLILGKWLFLLSPKCVRTKIMEEGQ